MPSRLTVVLVSLLLATPAVIFWLWLVILPARMARLCPEGCWCGVGGYYVECEINTTQNMPYNYPTVVRYLTLMSSDLPSMDNDTYISRGLTGLKDIDISFCRIETIESGAFNGLKKLTYLDLSINEISELLPRTFEKLSSLKKLDLSSNRIEKLEVDLFSGLINVRTIDLSDNNITYIHPDTFAGLENLKNVRLGHNSDLQVPTDRHFINSLSVSYIYLSNCNIMSVSVKTFAKVTALEWLDLSHNNLISVDINILNVLPKLSAMYLYDNPLQCDCQLQAVWRRCQDHNIETAYEETMPECETPSEVQGIWWGVLDKGQCLQDNISYGGDYKNTTYSYTESVTNPQKSYERYETPVHAVLLTFGAAGNIIILIIIIIHKDMRTLPNMYILNLAVGDIIYLIVHFLESYTRVVFPELFYLDIIHIILAFSRRLSVVISAYSVAVLSIQRYRVIVNPLHVRASSQPAGRTTVATICGVWIVAALFAIPSAVAHISIDQIYLELTYYEQVVMFDLLVSSVLPLCVIAFSYAMTARHVLKSAVTISQHTQSPHFKTRKRIGKIVFGLTFVFLISNVPYHVVWAYIISIGTSYYGIAQFLFPADEKLLYIFILSRDLILINSCLNPVALFCTSRAFKTHLKRYLTCRRKENSPLSNMELARVS